MAIKLKTLAALCLASLESYLSEYGCMDVANGGEGCQGHLKLLAKVI